MDHIKESIGKRIRTKRKERKLSAEELGNRVGVSKSFISKVETGKSKASVEFLNKISDVLNTPISYFLDEFKEEPDEELKQEDVEWIYFRKEVEQDDISIEEIKKIYKFYKMTLDDKN
ncbi:helix-turn-helix transcriptional regulator [Sutcliffiella horikoshii]|uniref:Helix-turn-helix transcriptional regulator n=1 Tax=Sutcliffiella horikoshii TaxID=79883 RepID=A0A5D4T162_9BACI|nr:helix-turn-helix transcriptional regulator [Sutcliffiella horikoshii]TYS68691.1 helix-turn-helix transcriptional regulator [Sutcliffiella horikoshii]